MSKKTPQPQKPEPKNRKDKAADTPAKEAPKAKPAGKWSRNGEDVPPPVKETNLPHDLVRGDREPK